MDHHVAGGKGIRGNMDVSESMSGSQSALEADSRVDSVLFSSENIEKENHEAHRGNHQAI